GQAKAHLAGSQVKDRYVRVVGSRGGQSFSVGTEGHTAPHGGSESRQAAKHLTGGHFPDPHRAVLSGRGEGPAIRTERHTSYPVLVAQERPHGLARRGVPELHAAVKTPAGKEPAVRAIGNAENLIGMAAEGVKDFAGRRVPDFERAVIARRG